MRVLGFLVGALALAGSAWAGDADPKNFFLKLESVGLSTEYVRALAAKFRISFDFSSEDDPAGLFSLVTGRMKINRSLAEAGSDRIKFDLPHNDFLTLIHEFTHADYYHNLNGGFTEPTVKGAADSPEKAHYDAWWYWKNDIRGAALIVRFSNLRAEEVCGYSMEANVGELFEIVNHLVKYNTQPFWVKDIEKQFGPLDQLGDELVLPDGSANFPNPAEHKKVAPTYAFGDRTCRPYFENKPFEFTDNVEFRRGLYKRGLGLKTPKTTGDLIDRLNRIRNPWIDGIRLQALNERRKAQGQPALTRLPDAPAGDRKLLRPRQGSEQ